MIKGLVMVDKSVSLTAGTLYPLLSHIAIVKLGLRFTLLQDDEHLDSVDQMAAVCKEACARVYVTVFSTRTRA
jgi:hypothetical protein